MGLGLDLGFEVGAGVGEGFDVVAEEGGLDIMLSSWAVDGAMGTVDGLETEGVGIVAEADGWLFRGAFLADEDAPCSSAPIPPELIFRLFAPFPPEAALVLPGVEPRPLTLITARANIPSSSASLWRWSVSKRYGSIAPDMVAELLSDSEESLAESDVEVEPEDDDDVLVEDDELEEKEVEVTGMEEAREGRVERWA